MGFFWILNFLIFSDSILLWFSKFSEFWIFWSVCISFRFSEFSGFYFFCFSKVSGFYFFWFSESSGFEFSKFSGFYFFGIYVFFDSDFLLIFWFFWILTFLNFLKFELPFSRTRIFRNSPLFKINWLKVGSVLGPLRGIYIQVFPSPLLGLSFIGSILYRNFPLL